MRTFFIRTDTHPGSTSRTKQKQTRPVYLLHDVLVSHVAGSSFGDEASSQGLGAASVQLVLVLGQPGQQEPVRQEALPGQHGATITEQHAIFTSSDGTKDLRKQVFKAAFLAHKTFFFFPFY